MTAPSPDLTLTITPPGGSPADYTQYLTYSGHQQQMTITQNFGRQGDTAVLPLTDEYSGSPHVRIPVMSQVSLDDNYANRNLFAGVVNDPVLQVTGPNRNEWTLNCTDYTYYADNAIVHGQYFGWNADDIMIDLTNQAKCGITAVRRPAGGFVAWAPRLASYVLNYNTLSAAWRQLATLAGSVTPYGWYVDQGLNLHFFDSSTAISSGVTFTTTPATEGSKTEGHILLDQQNGYEWDGTSVRNKILVQGATQTVTTSLTGPATDTWRADGVQSSWPLRYTVTGTPRLKINGTAVSATVVTGGGGAGGAWVIEQNAIGQWFLHAAAAPGAGTVIQVWYDYQVPVVAQAQDRASQGAYTGPNGGVFSMFVSDTSLTTAPMALARAQQQRTEYGFAAERFTFYTSEDWMGWARAGQTCTIVNQFIPDSQRSWALGINDTFLVVANSVTFGKGGYRQCQITAVRV